MATDDAENRSPVIRQRPRRRGLTDRRLLVGEGLFSGTATSAHQTFFITLLVQLGVGSLALGVYSALNGLLTNATGLAGSRLQRRVPNRRVLAAIAGGIGRGMFFLVALLLLVQGDDVSPTVLIVIALVSAALIGISLPMVTAIIADAVNQRERGAFFGNRLLASGVGSAIVAIGIAAVLRQMTFPNGFIVAYVFAGLAGVASAFSTLSLRRVRRRSSTRGESTLTAQTPIPAILWRYSLATLVLWTGAGMVGPVLVPFIINDLGAGASFIGIMTAVNALVAISIQRFWGRRVDREGSFTVVRLSMIAVASLPILYGLTPTYWLALVFEVISGVGWAGYMLANFNYPLEIAPPRERTRYSAVVSAAAGVGSFIGPLIAAAMLQVLDPRPVLLAAGGIRAAAVVLMQLAKPEPRGDVPVAPAAGGA